MRIYDLTIMHVQKAINIAFHETCSGASDDQINLGYLGLVIIILDDGFVSLFVPKKQ